MTTGDPRRAWRFVVVAQYGAEVERRITDETDTPRDITGASRRDAVAFGRENGLDAVAAFLRGYGNVGELQISLASGVGTIYSVSVSGFPVRPVFVALDGRPLLSDLRNLRRFGPRLDRLTAELPEPFADVPAIPWGAFKNEDSLRVSVASGTAFDTEIDMALALLERPETYQATITRTLRRAQNPRLMLRILNIIRGAGERAPARHARWIGALGSVLASNGVPPRAA
jgi:hypothetical protein